MHCHPWQHMSMLTDILMNEIPVLSTSRCLAHNYGLAELRKKFFFILQRAAMIFFNLETKQLHEIIRTHLGTWATVEWSALEGFYKCSFLDPNKTFARVHQVIFSIEVDWEAQDRVLCCLGLVVQVWGPSAENYMLMESQWPKI